MTYKPYSIEEAAQDRPNPSRVGLRERIEARRREGYGSKAPPVKHILTDEEWIAAWLSKPQMPKWAPRDREPQRVYFIQAGKGGPIKIGIAEKPRQRLKGLQTSHHEELRLLATTHGGADQEAAYHKQFGEWRLKGEWFEPASPILAEIARLKGEV